MSLDTPTRTIEKLEATVASPAKPIRREAVGPRMLLVDDNAELAATLAIALSEEGIVAECASSAKIAKAKFESQRFDAVVIDLVMPGTHGMALLADLRASPQGKELPAVLLSELPEGEMRDQARRLVAKLKRAAFIDKPVSPRRLLVALGQVLAGR